MHQALGYRLTLCDSANTVQRTSLYSFNRYTPFGYAPHLQATTLGFTGMFFEHNIGVYLAGQGYRAFSPRLMRFASADDHSPFGRGGINTYAYCIGDPINYVDPEGTFMRWIFGLFNRLFRALGLADTMPSTVRRSSVPEQFSKFWPETSTKLPKLTISQQLENSAPRSVKNPWFTNSRSGGGSITNVQQLRTINGSLIDPGNPFTRDDTGFASTRRSYS